jgi:hypothetical protein
MKYYTYAYLREDGTPYYIGKGNGNRAFKRTKKCIKPPKDKLRIIFLKQNLTEEEAFKHEKYMIDIFGRKDLATGILYNKTDGGQGSSGATRSLELRNKISKSLKGRIVSEKTKRKLSEIGKSRIVSEETKRKLSKINKGKVISEETKRKMSESRKNRVVTEETRKKLSLSHKGRITNAKKYVIIDNDGNHYSSSTGLKNFCAEHKISFEAMYYALHFKNGNCSNGWKISYE